ncbi:MAG: Histidine-binding protein precursor (HBP) [Candidatus Carbobacillus altaicus]|uniref:Histidine-binding protein (HBP) n=1 Tax=Candidatus Carbonibacillus altaicus TaxID=2163959 RepID=A0A2R6Y2D3_9BACL|nr:MAG: Histidine-binding protein precursor (HBP) [Candidatus Carbobacillus altaicus]
MNQQAGSLKWNQSIRIFSLMIASFLLLFVLTACGSGSSVSTNNTPDMAAGSATEKGAATKEKIVVGSDAAYAPFEYIDTKGEIAGLDIELIKKMAELGEFEIEIRNLPWDTLFQEVKNGGVDVAISSITITEERMQTYDFTEPYFVANQLVLVKEDSPIHTFQDLKNAKYVGVQNATTGHYVVQELLGKTSPKIKSYESTPLAIQDMVNGGSDAVVADNAVVLEYIKNNPNVKFRSFDDPSFEKEYYGLMVKKGNQKVLDLLNSALQKAKEEGVIKHIFGSDVE